MSDMQVAKPLVRVSLDDLQGAWEYLKPFMPGVVRVDDMRPGKLVIKRDESFLIMFKRDFYHSFKNHFPYVKKESGVPYGYGQIMSKILLNKALDAGVNWLVFVMPDRKVYKCHVKLFKKFYDKNQTDVPYLPGEIAMPLDFFEPLIKEQKL